MGERDSHDQSRDARSLLADLRRRGVIVILDAPPILPMADMNLFSEVVDGIVRVVRAEQTPQVVVAEALRFLSGGSIEGVVLNDLVTPRHPVLRAVCHCRAASRLISWIFTFAGGNWKAVAL